MERKKLAPHPTVAPTATVIDSKLGAWTEVGPNTKIIETSMDDYSYAIDNCNIIYARIGKFCSIASHVRINPGNHPLQRPVLHHFTYRSYQFGLGEDDEEFFNWRRSFGVEIGHDVWIGHGAVILPGVRIGSGAAIGAGAVVTKDVPDFSIMAGVPAKPLRERFSSDIQAALLKISWWHWPHEAIQERLDDFRNLEISAFVEKYS
jgi:phosphonate metabolism protein (transferase hexapeptide repeat family)